MTCARYLLQSATIRTMAERGKSIWRLEEDSKSPEGRVKARENAGKREKARERIRLYQETAVQPVYWRVPDLKIKGVYSFDNR